MNVGAIAGKSTMVSEYRLNPPPIYQPASLPIPEPLAGKCHFLIDEFTTNYPIYACNAEACCAALKMAEVYVRGFTDITKRNYGLQLMAAHLIEVGSVAIAENTGRQVAMTQGTVARAGSTSPSNDEWLSLSAFGLAFKGLEVRNARLGVLIVG